MSAHKKKTIRSQKRQKRKTEPFVVFPTATAMKRLLKDPSQSAVVYVPGVGWVKARGSIYFD